MFSVEERRRTSLWLSGLDLSLFPPEYLSGVSRGTESRSLFSQKALWWAWEWMPTKTTVLKVSTRLQYKLWVQEYTDRQDKYALPKSGYGCVHFQNQVESHTEKLFCPVEHNFMYLPLSYPWYLASLCVLSMIFADTPSPSLLFFSSFQWKNRCSSIPDYFYLTLHYHNKTHAWKKKINSKRQRGQEPGFERLIFIFPPCLYSFMLLFSFRSEKWKATCLFIHPVPHYGAFQVCSFVWGEPRAMHRRSEGQPVDYPEPRVKTSTEPPSARRRTPLPSERWTL